MYIPNNKSRYGYGYGNNKMLRVAGACCERKYGCGANCGCGRNRYAPTTHGAASGQAATMMMPNIVINVQSGNRKSNDYTESSNSAYSPSESNPLYYAPSSTENNPTYSSYEHGGYYSGRYDTNTDVVPTTQTKQDVVPIILSPRAAQKARQTKAEFDPGVPPEYVGRRYPLEFP